MLSWKSFVLPVSGRKLDHPDFMSGCAISGNQLLQSHSSSSRRFAIAYCSLVRWVLLNFFKLSRSAQSDRSDIFYASQGVGGCVCVCVHVQYESVWGIETSNQCGKLSFVHESQGSLPSLALFLPMFEGDTSFAKLWRNRHTCLEECSQMSRDGSVCRPCADAIPTCARFETAEDSWVIRDATNLGSIWRCWWCHHGDKDDQVLRTARKCVRMDR